MRIFAISDLHSDFKQNWKLVEQLSDQDYKNDVLLIAGDISHNLFVVRRTLETLQSKFHTVFFVPGNHELWVSDRESNSIEKFTNVIKICKLLGVQVTPLKVANCWIIPLFSWYNSNFDTSNKDVKNELERWSDFYFCNWPTEINDIDSFFSKMNEPFIKKYNGPVISFSHFLPRLDLLPSINYLRFKGLPKVAGSVLLEHQIRKLNSKIHVFGHSHINCDVKIDGVYYIQNALSYPREKQLSNLPLKQIWQFKKVIEPVNTSY
jgi:Icc-related predicted phosphoesterase